MNKPKSSYRNLESALIVTLALVSCAFAQNGKLVDASPLAIKQSDAPQPALQSILDQVEIKSITYLSDGLKVKGYLAAPKKGEKLPCVIFNRGGNQSFVQWPERIYKKTPILLLHGGADWRVHPTQQKALAEP
jgi:dipeptidyl aminopeptidase/acylaminoacyl peptidase